MAGYILLLLRCIPEDGEKVRMQLYLGDVESQGQTVVFIRHLWLMVSKSSICQMVIHDKQAAVGILQEYLGPQSHNSCQQEWQVLLLFIDLYQFVLRSSDDDDFFKALKPDLLDDGRLSSRLRVSNLGLEEVESFTKFLKSLCFAIYYNTREISRVVNMSVYEFQNLRALLPTALRLLYSKDSRRRFLPDNHWLMTDRFGMDAFIAEVVEEEERRQRNSNDMDDDKDGNDTDGSEDSTEDAAQGAPINSMRFRLGTEARRKDQRIRREMHMVDMGPKLEILRNMPFVIPFETRVKIFKRFVLHDKLRRRDGDADNNSWRLMSRFRLHDFERYEARIRRGKLFQDAMERFWDLGDGLKEPIHITFVDKFGNEEAGIDGGGVTKEFLDSVTTEAFGEGRDWGAKLFIANKQSSMYPNPDSLEVNRKLMQIAGMSEEEELVEMLKQYEFLGRIVGKCMYEGVLLSFVFANFFLLKWTTWSRGHKTYSTSVNDLVDLDEDLHRGLVQLKNFDGDVSEWGLNFTVDNYLAHKGEVLGTQTVPLMRNGADVPVTNDNRFLFISAVARYRLGQHGQQQTEWFLRGLHSIISPLWLGMFNQNELQRLVSGDSDSIDIADLRANTTLTGGYAVEQENGGEPLTIGLFWQAMQEFTDKQRMDVVRFVTSTPRAPLLGFGQLKPKFTIRDGGFDEARLPSASTCVNLLKLPVYQSVETLKAKLLTAIEAGAGFDMS